MNDITEVDRLNAKIADLKRTVEWLQGRIGITMGAAAKGEIVGAPVRGAGEVPTDVMLKAGVYAFQHSYSSDDTLADWRAFYVAACAAAPAAPAEQSSMPGAAFDDILGGPENEAVRANFLKRINSPAVVPVAVSEHIAASVPQLAVPQGKPDINDDGHFESLLGSMHPLSKQCVIDFVNDWCRSALSAAPVAPLPELTESMDQQEARWAIDGAIAYGRMAVSQPAADHWLNEYWQIGRQLAELGKTCAWDNVTPLSSGAAKAVESRKMKLDFTTPDDFKAWWNDHFRKLADHSLYSKASAIWNGARSATSVLAAPLPEQTGPSIEFRVIEHLIAIASAAYDTLDNAEESGPVGDSIITIQSADNDALSAALDLLDALPDDKPGYTLSGPARASWALRELRGKICGAVAGPAAATLPAAPAPTRATAEQESEIDAAVKAGRITFELGWDDPRPAPAPTEQAGELPPLPKPLDTRGMLCVPEVFSAIQMQAYARAALAARPAPTEAPKESETEPGQPYMFKMPGDHDWQVDFAPLPEGARRITELTSTARQAPDSRDAALEEAAALFPQPYMEYFGENIQESIRALKSGAQEKAQ